MHTVGLIAKKLYKATVTTELYVEVLTEGTVGLTAKKLYKAQIVTPLNFS